MTVSEFKAAINSAINAKLTELEMTNSSSMTGENGVEITTEVAEVLDTVNPTIKVYPPTIPS